MLYSGSDEQRKLRAVQTYLRYLFNKAGANENMPLGISLPMLDQIAEVEEQLSYLKSAVHRAAYAEMLNLNVDSIETEGWEAKLLLEPSVTKVRSQEVAQALLEKIQEGEIRRNKKVPEHVVKSITATTFWSLIDTLSIKWSKTKLKKKGIDIEQYSEPGAPQNKITITRKVQR